MDIRNLLANRTTVMWHEVATLDSSVLWTSPNLNGLITIQLARTTGSKSPQIEMTLKLRTIPL